MCIFKKYLFAFLLGCCCVANLPAQTKPITDTDGKVAFTSEAPLELIKAKSDKLKGALDLTNNTFAFSVDITSFKGFNSDLQRQHFLENYMETDRFPTASFSGKFIEQADFSKDGVYQVRAKGMFQVHGIKKERLIKGTITVAGNTITVTAPFTVMLVDHDIKVPKIVYEKIAEEIRVDITISFKR